MPGESRAVRKVGLPIGSPGEREKAYHEDKAGRDHRNGDRYRQRQLRRLPQQITEPHPCGAANEAAHGASDKAAPLGGNHKR